MLGPTLNMNRGEHRTGIGGSGPENKKPDRVSGDFGGPDIRYIGGRGFRVSDFRVSGIFGAPDFDFVFETNDFEALRIGTRFESLHKSCSIHIGASNCKISAQSAIRFGRYALPKY